MRKKDGSVRLCVDFHELNRRTVPDRQPLPRVQSTAENLGVMNFLTIEPTKSLSPGIY